MPISNYSVSRLNDFKNILIILFFFPTFWGYLDIGKGQLFFLGATFFLISIILVSHQYKIRFPRIALAIFGALSFSYLLSLSINSISSQVIPKDFSDVSRPLFYLFYFSIPCFLKIKDSYLEPFIRVFITLTVAVLIFDVIKFIPQFTSCLKLYTLFEIGSLNYNRFSGTFCFCYNYGFIALFSLALCLYNNSLKYKYITITAYILLFVLIGSRSIMIASIVLLISYYFLSPKSFFKKMAFIPIVIVGLISMYHLLILIDIPIINNSIEYAERLIGALSGTTQDGSFNTRSSQLDRVITLFQQSPIIGNGPIKGNTPIEIQLGYYLSAWGIIGTCLFLSIMVVFFIWANRTSKSKNIIVSNFSKANRLWLIASFFVGMSTPITDQMRIFQIFYLLQGVQYMLYRNRTISKCNL